MKVFGGLNELANFHRNEVFNFCYGTAEEGWKEILNFSSRKATTRPSCIGAKGKYIYIYIYIYIYVFEGI